MNIMKRATLAVAATLRLATGCVATANTHVGGDPDQPRRP